MKSILKLISLSTLMVLCLLIFGCSKNSGYSNGGNTTSTNPNVSIKNFAFTVTTLKIGAGVTVKWTNNDGTSHTVTADDGSFDSGNIGPGASFTKEFKTKGTFAYHCSIHPMMKASVVVE